MSSDSEDDCYGNVAQQLQKLKNQYKEDKIDSVQLLNDSTELDEIVKNNPIPGENKRKTAGRRKKDPTWSSTSVSSSQDVIPDIIVQNSTKRKTRSSNRNSNIQLPPVEDLPPTRRRNVTTTQNASVNVSRGRSGRGGRARARGRGRQTRTSGTIRRHRDARLAARYYDSDNSAIPTYSVGNTEDYPDQSDNQVLFSNNATTADVVIIDDDNLEENEELNVKVYWTSSEYYRFSIRRFQKIAQIFDYFAQKENIGQDKLLFRLDGKILKPNDTPDSIGYKISNIIDGGIVEMGVSDLITIQAKVPDGIKLKFQCQILKKPFELVIKPNDKFSLTMVKVAEYLERPLEKLKFEFDGYSISGKLILNLIILILLENTVWTEYIQRRVGMREGRGGSPCKETNVRKCIV